MEYLTVTDILGIACLIAGALFIVAGMWWVPMREEEDVRYGLGELVWLAEFHNGLQIVPRQKAVILSFDNGMYTGIVKPDDYEDDGLREFSEDQIESVIPTGGL